MEHVIKTSKHYYTYGPNEAAIRVKPGDTIVAPTLDAGGGNSSGQRLPEEMKQEFPETILSSSNPLTGPFYIEGAEVGDSISVKIEQIILNRPTAYSAIRPHFTSFTEEDQDRRLLLNEPLREAYYQWQLDAEKELPF